MLEEHIRREIRSMLAKRSWYAYHPPDVKVLSSRPDLICVSPYAIPGCIIEVKRAEVVRLKSGALSSSFSLRDIPQRQRSYLDRRTQDGLNTFFAIGTVGKRIRFTREVLICAWQDWYEFEKLHFDHDIEEKEPATISWGEIRKYFIESNYQKTCFLKQEGPGDWIVPENHQYYDYFWTQESKFKSISDYEKLSISVPEPKKKETDKDE